MPISIIPITNKQKTNILSLTEGHFSDLKAIDIAPGKLTKTISAFANAEGGELYIGIDENKTTGVRTWRGFADIESANGHIQIFEELFPLGDSYSYNFLDCAGENGLVLKVETHKTRDIKYASDGIAYLRRGAQNLPQDTNEKIQRLKLDKGIISFESQTVLIDCVTISNSVPIIEFMPSYPTVAKEGIVKTRQTV